MCAITKSPKPINTHTQGMLIYINISFICRSVNNKAATQTNDFTRFHLIEKVLDDFRNLFHRKATYQWFVILVIGFMVRYDHLSVTSVIRSLSLDGNCYETMLR